MTSSFTKSMKSMRTWNAPRRHCSPLHALHGVTSDSLHRVSKPAPRLRPPSQSGGTPPQSKTLPRRRIALKLSRTRCRGAKPGSKTLSASKGQHPMDATHSHVSQTLRFRVIPGYSGLFRVIPGYSGIRGKKFLPDGRRFRITQQREAGTGRRHVRRRRAGRQPA